MQGHWISKAPEIVSVNFGQKKGDNYSQTLTTSPIVEKKKDVDLGNKNL